MIDYFAVFTGGGIVLWDYTWEKLKGEPVNHLIHTIFLEERSGTDQHNFNNYGMKWERANEQGLYFVVVFQNLMQKMQLYENLLSKAKISFLKSYGEELKNSGFPVPGQYDFEKQFQTVFSEVSKQIQQEKKESKAPKTFAETKRGKELSKDKKESTKKPNSPNSKTPNTTKTNYKEGEKRQKKATTWKVEEHVDAKDLNISNETLDDEEVKQAFLRRKLEEDNELYDIGGKTVLDFSDSDTEEEEEKPNQATTATSGIMSFFSSITNKELSEKDLKPVLEQFKTSLIIKNVAQEIAEKICESVCNSLVGKKLGTFTRVKTTVEEAMSESLTRLLTPKRTIDILRDTQLAKNEKRPYVITMVGVNGVGKTTSLAKIVSWLQQNKLKVVIAACDTYRSGAVEQLFVHANNLGVELIQSGYGKDAAGIAASCIEKARKESIDVVLIDTSGRMQDNTPLMKDLAKLVDVNKPDLVLFVGEALVGNDSVDQLTKFNACIEENSKVRKDRGIDGIILTKFDTVDEKVGAAISMVYTTGQPIVFVGVGQKYSDLKVLDVKKMVSILLK